MWKIAAKQLLFLVPVVYEPEVSISFYFSVIVAVAHFMFYDNLWDINVHTDAHTCICF